MDPTWLRKTQDYVFRHYCVYKNVQIWHRLDLRTDLPISFFEMLSFWCRVKLTSTKREIPWEFPIWWRSAWRIPLSAAAQN